ncbi:MAG: hypothetical protein AAF502_15145 [Bacteroidota bacterium]
MEIQNKIRKRKEEIQLLVAAGNIKKAIKRSMDYASDFCHDNLILQSLIELNIDYNVLLSQEGRSNGQGDSFRSERNTLVIKLLEHLDSIESTF